MADKVAHRSNCFHSPPAPKLSWAHNTARRWRELAGWLIQIIRSYAFKCWQPPLLLQHVSQTSLHLIWHLTFYDGRQLPLWGRADFSAERVKPARQHDPGGGVSSTDFSCIFPPVEKLIDTFALTLFTLKAGSDRPGSINRFPANILNSIGLFWVLNEPVFSMLLAC